MKDTDRSSYRVILDLLLLLAWIIPAFGSIPSGYYDSASGKTGTELKSALHMIISDHTKKTYDQAWDIIKESDEDPNNSNNVILLYTGRSQEKEYRDHGSLWDYTVYDGGDGEYNESWNREHVWAKSHGFPSESDTAYTDCHHLRPVDRSVNSSRNNKDFDDGGTLHSETTDCYTDSDSWEPRDEVKGDIARMTFYMAIRYDPGIHSDDSEYDLELVDSTGMDLGSSPGRPVLGKLSTLLEWHAADTVDAFERQRNEVVYGYQANRNPFIDHPEYVTEIWNSALAAPSNLTANDVSETSLSLTWADNASDESGYYLYRDNTKISTFSSNTTNASLTGLTSGTTYNFKVSAYKTAEESSKASLDVTTGGTGNLIITGVYDGPLTGGLPKGIELYVISSIADLSNYGIGSATNGGGTDGEEFTFPADGASAGEYIYVASESSQFNTWFGFSPDYTSNSVGVNGNDAVELFYNSTAIDVFGDINTDGTGQSWEYLDGWAYSKNNRGVSTSFNSAHWTFSGTNALDGESTNATATDPIPTGTFSYTDGSLPVELSVWSGRSGDGVVQLSWVTESEIENQGFIIERTLREACAERSRSTQGPNSPWTEIASFSKNRELLGQGSTTKQTEYYFTDKQVKVGETYSYRLFDVDYAGNVSRHGERSVVVTQLDNDQKPQSLKLLQAYPNPFNPSISIPFELTESQEVSVDIYAVDGALVTRLGSANYGSGIHKLTWQGLNDEGGRVQSGIYIVKISSNSSSQIQRITLLR